MKCGAEDFGLLFICSCAWFGKFRPSFPYLTQYLSTWETGIAQPTEGPDTRVRSHLMWKKELKTLDYFSWVSALDLRYLLQYPSTCETGIDQLTEGPDTTVRSHLMWNKELKNLDYFSCVSAHDLGYSSPVSTNCSNTWVPVKQV